MAESSIPGQADDWQGSRSLSEACSYMLTNQIATDVELIVGEDETKVKAHKFILISRSCVFQAMLCGEYSEKGEPIRIPDIEPDIFRSFLEMLYMDKLEVTGDNVLALLYTAKKYGVHTLVKRCLAFLSEGRSVENICSILEQAHMYDEHEFHQKSLDFILQHGTSVLQHKSFLDLCKDCVKVILASDDLQADEKDVFDSVMQWTEAKCEAQNMEKTAENLRKVLGDILYLIRFPVLGDAYFTDYVSDSDLLSAEEKVELFQFFYKSSGHNMNKFNDRRRAGTKSVVKEVRQELKVEKESTLQTCIRFPNVSDSDSWCCSGDPDAISFSANKEVMLNGILVYGSFLADAVYTVDCMIYGPNEELIVSIQKQEKTSEHQHTYPVLLEKGVIMKRNEKYTAVLLMENKNEKETYQGENGQVTVSSAENVKFTFSKSKLSRNGTDVKMGQIPGLLYSVIN